jgi:hypothetical protein
MTLTGTEDQPLSQLTPQEEAQMLRELRQAKSEVSKMLARSPCIHRGTPSFAWCSNCNGWHAGCNARRPEALYKDRQGHWKHD